MSKVLDELLSLLALERIEENLFRGQSQDLGWGLVFGGQVLGQALSAAVQTVPADRVVHSLHAYFLRPGDASKSIVYDVDRIRDGSSFTTRRVVAIQSGRPIFSMSCSFQIPEVGFEHADTMPVVAGPDGLENERDLWQKRIDRIPKSFRARAIAERPIELRPVDPVDPLSPDKAPPTHAVWMRTDDKIDDKVGETLGNSLALHQYLLAYCSDFGFMTTALRPHAVTWANPEMHVASIDHAMWFHRPFRVDDWVLHVIESPTATGARGLVRGQIYARDGSLIASTAQEGLMRKRARPS
jgi:acyl-CoA thioesterase-2